MLMISLKLQTALGGFALITLLMARLAVGRVFRLSLGEALYLTTFALVMVGWLINQVIIHRCANPSSDENGEA